MLTKLTGENNLIFSKFFGGLQVWAGGVGATLGMAIEKLFIADNLLVAAKVHLLKHK